MNDAEFDIAMEELLPDARYYAIFARGKFAVRYGPMDFASSRLIVTWAETRAVPVMITADCGPLPGDLALDALPVASLFGETLEEREKLRDAPKAAAELWQALMFAIARWALRLVRLEAGSSWNTSAAARADEQAIEEALRRVEQEVGK